MISSYYMIRVCAHMSAAASVVVIDSMAVMARLLSDAKSKSVASMAGSPDLEGGQGTVI
jgi:hypothetical protein